VAITAALDPLLGSGASEFVLQVKMTSAQYWPVFTEPPEKIVQDLLAAYPPEETDLFVPLMTDYEEWLGGDPKWFAWKLSEDHAECRVEWKKRVIREGQGRIHLFAPFCPLRAAAQDIEAEVGKAVGLVEDDGFLGVKLYPLMGYFPCGNRWKCKADWLPAARRKGGATWRRIDEALDRLYAECEAHCSPQGSRSPLGASRFEVTQANQAHPRNWLPVLRRHPALRLNLAHMGGDRFQTVPEEEKETATDWAFQIARLMGNPAFAHVYADRACQLPPADAGELAAYGARLAHVLSLNDQVPLRTMNGTDWHLALMYGQYKGEWREANARFETICAPIPGFSGRFFGDNAADFLGLRPGGKNRERLRKLYEDKLHLEEDRFPAWWAKV